VGLAECLIGFFFSKRVQKRGFRGMLRLVSFSLGLFSDGLGGGIGGGGRFHRGIYIN
jgi:hypothetical protein